MVSTESKTLRKIFSGFVNVCSAVCLLLLVGGLSPLSSAAPHGKRSTMERQKRATSENYLWGNPCDFDASSGSNSMLDESNLRTVAEKLLLQTKFAYTSALAYKDSLAKKLHSYDSFDEMIKQWDTSEWLRRYSFPAEVLPKDKILYKNMPDEHINKVMMNIDSVLPSLYKALKVVVAGLHSLSSDGLNDSIAADEKLQNDVNQTMHNVRAVLCYLNDVMSIRKLEIMPLLDSDAPKITPDNVLIDGMLLYYDTLKYLEYLQQIFQKLY